jgi:hypothetical protein
LMKGEVIHAVLGLFLVMLQMPVESRDSF